VLDRYTSPAMHALWSDRHTLELWTRVSVAAVKARFPHVTGIDGYPPPPVYKVRHRELETRHDVVAFLDVWTEPMSLKLSELVHRGMTSSDLVDSANAIRLGVISELIGQCLVDLQRVLANRVIDLWSTPRLGRTHGQPAEETTWGYRLADLLFGLARAHSAFEDNGSGRMARVKMSGPVGTYRQMTYEQEAEFARLLGSPLLPSGVATQVILRDGYARWVYDLAHIATLIESLALQIRLGAQFEVLELQEPNGDQQVGSSAMPHKLNPIMSERLCGLAKLVRAQIVPVMEGMALWGERDISHSSVERVALSTASILTHFMLVEATTLMRDLHIDRTSAQQNLAMAGDRINTSHFLSEMVSQGHSARDARARIKLLYAQAPRRRRITVQLFEEFGIRSTQPKPMKVDHVLARIKKLLSDLEVDGAHRE
jgi:adenylosuccinate lyase